jgi:hypothetical protein
MNVEELDRIIDGAKSVPLSESDSQKPKTALHTLAEQLLPPTKTEKTSSVFGEESAAPENEREPKDPPAGHGLDGADAYRGAKKVEIAHGNWRTATVVRTVPKGTSTRRKSQER